MSKKLSINGFANKEWLSLTEILNLELDTLPNIEITLRRLAKKENWKKRETQSNTGGRRGYEYHIGSLPLEARVDLLNRLANMSKDAGGSRFNEAKKSKNIAATTLSKSIEATTPLDNINSIDEVDNKANTTKDSKNNGQLDIVNWLSGQEEVASVLSKAEHFGSEIDKRNLEKARAKEQILFNLVAYRKELALKGKESFLMQLYVDRYNKGLIVNKELYQNIPTLSVRSVGRWKSNYKAQGLKGLLENWESKGRKSTMSN
ncbi:Helix-turn-helix domain-containing protein [Candidatus Hepatincolaceae symbiont of Richtersius coronifer]